MTDELVLIFFVGIYLLIVSIVGITSRIIRGVWWSDVGTLDKLFGFKEHPPSYRIWVIIQFIMGIIGLIFIINYWLQ